MRLFVALTLLLLMSVYKYFREEVFWVPAKLIHQQLALASMGGCNSFWRQDQYITLWDCGDYGTLESRSRIVFRKARLANRVKIESMYLGLMVTDCAIDDAKK